MAEGTPVGRRVVFVMLGLGALGVAVGADVQRGTDRFVAPLRENDPTGLTDLLPSGGFRYYSVVASVPERTSADYELRVHGLVDRPLTLTLDDLSRMPQTELVRDFQCVTGWRVTSVRWTGVRLADLLDAAGTRPGATALTFRSFDGAYTESLTIDQARRPDVLVALTMLDGPITHDHGGPVRLYVAPMYGYKSIKWLAEIEVVDTVTPGFWEQRGYDVDGWIGKSNGRDDEPV
ncbi:molybdopterin-dependent oxidoreductase [Parafrankia sp. BMG5.11]|uniref:molybdopterin-dependent oxidoreductase n=2 Tax=Frankiaceae TaxID=74712 RepID=UPI000AD62F99|nr:methionine sulfoxide reductase catalytic subunit [Frankia sp. Hr75.2]SQD98864.1 Oxidoreductase molybdopterin binding [Parafrankia sp. Ea1.12]